MVTIDNIGKTAEISLPSGEKIKLYLLLADINHNPLTFLPEAVILYLEEAIYNQWKHLFPLEPLPSEKKEVRHHTNYRFFIVEGAVIHARSIEEDDNGRKLGKDYRYLPQSPSREEASGI